MKVNATVFAVVAMAAAATAVPRPEAETGAKAWLDQWCQVPGAPCLKNPRGEENALAYTIGDEVGACGVPGQPCNMVKRAAFAINDILQRHTAANPFPCSPGTFCNHKQRDLDAISQAAIDGYDLVVKREAEAEAAAFQKRNLNAAELELPTALIDYCDEDGVVCARNSTASPEKREIVKRCVFCIRSCTQQQREACEKLARQRYRNNHPQLYIHNKHPTIHAPGEELMPDPKCDLVPGKYCIKKRDAPLYDQEELMQPAGIADSLFAIKDAIDTIKREAAEHRGAGSPYQKYQHCFQNGGCGHLTQAHLVAEHVNPHEAGQAHHSSWSPQGLSTHAMPFFNDIEKRVNAAVETLEDYTKHCHQDSFDCLLFACALDRLRMTAYSFDEGVSGRLAS